MASFGKIATFVFVVAYLGCTTAELISETCTRKERVCERGSALTISCPAGQTIFVIHAAYGRTEGSDVCPGSNADGVTDCLADTSLDIVQGSCNGEYSCTVSASNGVFGDPCRGTRKYLEVIYECS